MILGALVAVIALMKLLVALGEFFARVR